MITYYLCFALLCNKQFSMKLKHNFITYHINMICLIFHFHTIKKPAVSCSMIPFSRNSHKCAQSSASNMRHKFKNAQTSASNMRHNFEIGRMSTLFFVLISALRTKPSSSGMVWITLPNSQELRGAFPSATSTRSPI